MPVRMLLAVGLALVVVASAAAPDAAQTPTPQRGGTFVVAIDADPPTLNPEISVLNQTFWTADQLYETLVSYDAAFKPVPRLATAWTVSPDGKTYRFTLARNAKWHDGTPFTSADVQYTFGVFGPKYSPYYKTVLAALEAVDAPDAGTVVFRFSKPNGVLLSLLGEPAFVILPKHIYESGDPRTNPANTQPVGTGPFKLKEWVRGDHLTFVRNDAYYQQGLPYLDQVVFRIIPNAASAVAGLEQGEVSMVLAAVLPNDAKRLESTPGVKVVSPSVLARIIGLWPNLKAEHLQQLRVRQALSLAADRPRMIQEIAFGEGAAARGPIASTSPYFDQSLPALRRDVPAANKLLDEAGLKRGGDGTRFSLRLRHVASLETFAKTAQILKENFADVGVRVDIIAAETTTTLTAIFVNSDFDVAVYSAPMGPEPGLALTQYLSSQGLTKAFFSNAPGYQNLKVDQLIGDSVATTDQAKRAVIYKQIQQMIMADLPVIPLWEPRFLTAYRTDFQNVFLQPDDRYINFTRTWHQSR